MKNILLIFTITFTAMQLNAQDLALYEKKIFQTGGDTLRYRILLPEDYVKGKTYPLIVFLHGSGERGNDNESQLKYGATLFLRDSIRKKYPAIVVFPQCPHGETWSHTTIDSAGHFHVFHPFQLNPSTQEKLIKLLIEDLVNNGMADSKRIYLGGLSIGGLGVYDMILRYGNFFAAAFPIAAQSDVEMMLKSSINIPLWIFHGAKDSIQPPEPDRRLYKGLIRQGDTKVKYTEYPNADHNSWNPAFEEPELLPWLFAQ